VKFTDTVAQASMVYVQTKWKGWVVLSKNLDVSSTEYLEPGSYGPFEAVTSCSGFVASPSGDMITAGHCVDAASFYGGKGAIITAAMAEFTHSNGVSLTPAEQASWGEVIDQNASVEGTESGSPVDRTVTTIVPAVSDTSHPTQVVDVQPFTEGDVALLHAEGVTAPVLSVAQATPTTGDSVVAAGYPGSVAEVVDPSTQASFMEGTVSGTKTVNGTPFTQISADVSAGMSGGPVLNMAGQVVGTVSWAPSGTTSANFMTDVASIRSMLAANGVSNKLTPADQAFRQGLAYFFAGRYHEAVQQFDQTLDLQPGQPVAQAYRQTAVTRYPQDTNPPSSGQSWWIYVVIGAAVLVAAGATGTVLIMRRRRARPPGGKPAALVPGPTPPEPTMRAGPVPGPAPAEPAPRSQPVPEATGPAGPIGQDTPAGQETPLFCPNCRAEHPREAHYCERCGQPFAVAFPTEHGGDEGIRR
jgi:hypothetical protein